MCMCMCIYIYIYIYDNDNNNNDNDNHDKLFVYAWQVNGFKGAACPARADHR